MGWVVEADPVWHRPVGPSQPFRAGDSPTPKGGMLHSVTGGGEGVAGPSSMLSTTRQIVVKGTPRDSVRVCVPLVVQCAAHCTVASASAAKFLWLCRQPASVCRYGHNALFSLKETKSASNAEQPQAAPVV